MDAKRLAQATVSADRLYDSAFRGEEGLTLENYGAFSSCKKFRERLFMKEAVTRCYLMAMEIKREGGLLWFKARRDVMDDNEEHAMKRDGAEDNGWYSRVRMSDALALRLGSVPRANMQAMWRRKMKELGATDLPETYTVVPERGGLCHVSDVSAKDMQQIKAICTTEGVNDGYDTRPITLLELRDLLNGMDEGELASAVYDPFGRYTAKPSVNGYLGDGDWYGTLPW